MNILTNVEHLKNLMRSLGISPKDYMGQNFLISEDILGEIIDAAEIKKGETIIEIGPGLGVLTQQLVEKAGKIIAIEKDKRFVPLLEKFFRESHNLEIANQDVLRFDFDQIKDKYKIVANIPYYLTSHLLEILLALNRKPSRIVFMVQKEVAERLVAEAGQLSVLAISVQIFADVSIAAIVPKQNFWPEPKVDSAIIVIEPKNKFPEITDQKLYFRILKIAFAGKRKQLHNTLVNGLKWDKSQVEEILRKVKIAPTVRPQELTIEQWVELYKIIKRSGDSVQRSGK